MRFLIMTDIEGVTGVTSYQQAESSRLGKDMLTHDLLAVIEGIRAGEHHEIVVYDMHTDGRNVDLTSLPEDVAVVMGKPVNGLVYKGIGGDFDGLFLVGLHAMSRKPGAMLAHSYLVEYDSILVNGEQVGEIGVEAMLAGEQGIPLLFVSGDDMGCEEAAELIPGVVTAKVKRSLGESAALCLPPSRTGKILRKAAAEAVRKAKEIEPKRIGGEVSIRIRYSECHYLEVLKKLHPEILISANTAEISGKGMLSAWSGYLAIENEVVRYES